jgi:hypothetical protein
LFDYCSEPGLEPARDSVSAAPRNSEKFITTGEPSGVPGNLYEYIPLAAWLRLGAAGSGAEMPLVRYFAFVGGILLALLFISDAMLPKQPLPSFMNVASSEQPLVRIHSDRKWPERIVFDTSAPAVRPVTVAEALPAPRAEVAEIAVKAGVRDAFARFTPPVSISQGKTEAIIDVKKDAKTDQGLAKVAEARPQPKRKVAKARPSRPLILVAQQPHFGLFASTW